jgi:fibronectin type 3 domain-containing protein
MKMKKTILEILLITGILLSACSTGTGPGGGGGGGLAAPSKVTAEGTSSTGITLTWTVVSGAAKYKIYTAVTSTGVYRYVDETEERTYIVNDLVPASTYYYKVSSVDINGMEGPQSTYAEGTTKEQTIPVPGSVSAAALSSDSIRINWNSVTGATSYNVYRSSSASGSYALISTRTDTTYTDTVLTPLTTYYYRVSAVTSRGEGEQSNQVSATTPAEGVIPAPGGLQASPQGSDSIRISWNAVPEATGYKIYRSSSASGSYTLLNSSPGTSYTDTGLSPLTTYYYKISTVHSKGESEQSNSVSAATPAEPSIQPPSGISASAQSASSIQVSWNAVSGATGYKVYRSDSASGSYALHGSASAPPYTDSGLSASSTWYYKVSSVKDSQESAMSSSYASATTQSGGGTIDYPPAMPTGLVASSVSSGSITLTWNSVSTASSYNVYRSNTQTGTEAKINTSQVTGTTYTDNVPSGAAYYYKVVGVNTSGESPKSAGAFAYATSHYTLSYYAGAQTLSLSGRATHYYRLAVTQGTSYTIEWQNGSNQDIGGWRGIYVDAYQNDGTSIFSDAGSGYTNPRVFTATATGFVTIRLRSDSDNSQNYQIYYY